MQLSEVKLDDSPSTHFNDKEAENESPYSTDSEELEEAVVCSQSTPTSLSRLAYRRLVILLCTLTPRRRRIAQCMALALNHAYAAKRIAQIVSESLMEFTTPIARKVARLYVVSDILYNSAAPVPHAWQYRDAFYPYLHRIFTHFRQVMHLLPGRIKAHTFRQQISRVVDVWDQWLVYPPMLLQQLRDKLH